MQKRTDKNCYNFLIISSTQAEYQNFGLGMHVVYELSNKSQISVQTKSSNNNQDKSSNVRTKPDD